MTKYTTIDKLSFYNFTQINMFNQRFLNSGPVDTNSVRKENQAKSGTPGTGLTNQGLSTAYQQSFGGSTAAQNFAFQNQSSTLNQAVGVGQNRNQIESDYSDDHPVFRSQGQYLAGDRPQLQVGFGGMPQRGGQHGPLAQQQFRSPMQFESMQSSPMFLKVQSSQKPLGRNELTSQFLPRRSQVQPFFKNRGNNATFSQIEGGRPQNGDNRQLCATIPNKRPLHELEARKPTGQSTQDVLKALDRIPVVTKPDFGKNSRKQNQAFSQYEQIRNSQNIENQLFHGVHDDLRSRAQENKVNNQREAKGLRPLRKSHHSPTQPGQPSQCCEQQQNGQFIQSVITEGVKSVFQAEFDNGIIANQLGQNRNDFSFSTQLQHEPLQVIRDQQLNQNGKTRQNDFLQSYENQLEHNAKAQEIIPLLDRVEMRKQALKKADLIWESSVHLHESMLQDKLYEERLTTKANHTNIGTGQEYCYQVDALTNNYAYQIHQGQHDQETAASSGGLFDHINCLWTLGPDNGESMRIHQIHLNNKRTMLNNQDQLDTDYRPPIFEHTFDYKITFAQCFKLPAPMFESPAESVVEAAEAEDNTDNAKVHEYRILVFTTDYIYQLKVSISDSVGENGQKVEITRDEEIYQKILSNQIEFTTAKQHQSGLILAGGSQGQLIQIWITSPKTQNGKSVLNQALTFLNLNSNKKGKLQYEHVEGYLRDKLMGVFNVFNFNQGPKFIKSIDFQPYNLKCQYGAALILNEQYPASLSKVRIYKVNIPYYVTLAQDYPNLTFITSISIKQVLSMAYKVAKNSLKQEQGAEVLQANPSLAPVEIKFSGIQGNLLSIYLQNGTVISLNIFNLDHISIYSIEFLPMQRSTAIANNLMDEKQNGVLFNTNQNMKQAPQINQFNEFGSNLNPLFPEIVKTSKFKFKSDHEQRLLYLAQSEAAGRYSGFQIQISRILVDKNTRYEFHLIRKLEKDEFTNQDVPVQFLVQAQRDIQRDSTIITSSIKIDSNNVLDMQCHQKHTKILYANGKVQMINSYQPIDHLCQYLHIMVNFNQQAHRPTMFNQSKNLKANSQNHNLINQQGKQLLTSNLNDHLDSLYQDLMAKLAQSQDQYQKQTFSIVFVNSPFYSFLKNVLNVIISQSTFKSSRNVSQFYSSVKDADLDTYLRFEAPKQDMGLQSKVTPYMIEEAQILLNSTIQKYFGQYFVNDRQNMKMMHNQEFVDQPYETVDNRSNQYDQLSLERYSPIGQVRAILAIDALNIILGQSKNWLKEKVFSVDKLNRDVMINQRCSSHVLKSKMQALKKLKEFCQHKLLVANHPQQHNSQYQYRVDVSSAPTPMSNVVRIPLFESLMILFEYIEESFNFFNISIAQKPYKRQSDISRDLLAPKMWELQYLIEQYQQSLRTYIKPESLQDLTLEDFIILGPRKNDTVLKIIETFIAHDNIHSDDSICNNYLHYLEPQMASLTLSRKYFERSKAILKENQQQLAQNKEASTIGRLQAHLKGSPTPLTQSQSMRRNQQIQLAMRYLMSSTLYSSLYLSTKLMIENYLYGHSVIYAIKKAQDCSRAQTFLQDLLLQQSNAHNSKHSNDRHVQYENIDLIIQDFQQKKDDSHQYILDALQIAAQVYSSQTAAKGNRAVNTQQAREWAYLQRRNKDLEVGAERSILKNQKVDRRNLVSQGLTLVGFCDTLRENMVCRKVRLARFGAQGAETLNDGNQGEAKSYKSDFQSVQLMERQLKQLKSPAEVHDVIITILQTVSQQNLGPAAPNGHSFHQNSKTSERQGEAELFHHQIFDILMKNGMIEELHGFNSPYLEKFIQNGMWQYSSSQNHQSLSDSEVQKKKFETIIKITCKHYMKIKQPISLLNYIYDALIEHCDQPQNLIDVEERIEWLQKVLAYMPTNFRKEQISQEFMMKQNKVMLVVKILQLQKIVRNKMVKVAIKVKEEGKDEENQGLKEDLQIINQKFSYSIIIKLKDMLGVAQDYNLFSAQLRIVSLMVEQADVSHSKNQLSSIANNAWGGLIFRSLLSKIIIPNIEASDGFRDHQLFPKLGDFVAKVKKFQRIVEGENKYKIELFNSKVIIKETIELTQAFLLEHKVPLEFFLENEPMYWLVEELMRAEGPGGAAPHLNQQIDHFNSLYDMFTQRQSQSQSENKGTASMNCFHLFTSSPFKFIYPFKTFLAIVDRLQSGEAAQPLADVEKRSLHLMQIRVDSLLVNSLDACFNKNTADQSLKSLQLQFSQRLLDSYATFKADIEEASRTLRQFQ